MTLEMRTDTSLLLLISSPDQRNPAAHMVMMVVVARAAEQGGVTMFTLTSSTRAIFPKNVTMPTDDIVDTLGRD